jgi:hypothetical protein
MGQGGAETDFINAIQVQVHYDNRLYIQLWQFFLIQNRIIEHVTL